MNKINKLWLLWACFLTITITACEDDHAHPVETGIKGLVVVNQGNFSQGNGSLDLYLPETEEMQQNVYQTVNGEPVGGIIESASIAGNTLAVMVNQLGAPGKIIFADAATLELQHELADANTLYSPRYAAFTNEHVFVSVWGDFDSNWNLTNSSIAVIDRATHTLKKSIPVPAGPEGVLIEGTHVWVANAYADSITIIDASSHEVVQKFKSVHNPVKLEKGPGDKIYVLAGDTLARYHAATFLLEQKVKLPGSATKWQFVNNELYFLTQEWSADYSTTSNKLYRMAVDQANAQPQQILQMEDARTFWIDPQKGDIFLGIAGGADPGTLLQLKADGTTELGRMAAGIFPHQILAR